MKRVLIFALLTLSLTVVTSCKNDDFDKNEWRQFRLTDKWQKVLTIHYDEDNNVIKTEIPVETGCPAVVTEFLEDKTVTETTFQKVEANCKTTTTDMGTWEVNYSTVTIYNKLTHTTTSYSLRKLNALDLELEYSIYNANASEKLKRIRIVDQYVKTR